MTPLFVNNYQLFTMHATYRRSDSFYFHELRFLRLSYSINIFSTVLNTIDHQLHRSPLTFDKYHWKVSQQSLSIIDTVWSGWAVLVAVSFQRLATVLLFCLSSGMHRLWSMILTLGCMQRSPLPWEATSSTAFSHIEQFFAMEFATPRIGSFYLFCTKLL